MPQLSTSLNVPNIAGDTTLDLPTWQSMDEEYFVHMFPAIPFKQIDRINTTFDPLYLEQSAKVFTNPVSVNIYVQLDPQKEILEKYGLSAPQDAIAVFCNKLLDDLKIPRPTIGDQILYYQSDNTGFLFELLTVKQWDFWVNSQIALHTVCTLKNLNPL